MKRSFALAAALVFASGAALAFHCPADIKMIDEALPKSSLSAEKKAEVTKYRNEGEALHKAGKHQEAVDTLAKGMKMLGIGEAKK